MAWEWVAIAGLGIFHGINPAMGWLFAVALGLHRRSRRAVLWAVAPMALGHALSIAVVAGLVLATGFVFNGHAIRIVSGGLLIAWAAYHLRYGHRHRVRVGMTTEFAGLVLWSFLMATAHGAGLMLVPVLIPLCGAMPAHSSGPLLVSLAAVGLHTLATLLVTGAIALLVYDWLGVGVLRRGWINFDSLWTAGLAGTGLLLIATA
ncbi:membrane protein [Caballeronia sordidicola]|uniref:Membrane protein n=2 Tax=Caballeronia sordidicola TaxID=196367 RepID=A0A158GQP9_CABSO|nr:membrane protein [Caballeronia sordidicola]